MCVTTLLEHPLKVGNSLRSEDSYHAANTDINHNILQTSTRTYFPRTTRGFQELTHFQSLAVIRLWLFEHSGAIGLQTPTRLIISQ